ncbi:unnamed protein product [Scytosiphon promiscuus]
MGNGASSSVSWHDVRDMSPVELADLMVRECDPSFGKHHQTIIDHAVGGGIVCALGEQSLRAFLTDVTITLKPQQDFIVKALDELRRNTEVAVAALEASGSPYKHSVVRNLRTHHAAYVTFTKEGDTFRGATKFTKSLKKIIDGGWDPPNAPVNVRLRGSGTLGVAREPLLHEVAKSLNVVWLVSAGSLLDPFCLMEVCAAVRQGTPVLPVRLAGAGIRPLNLPIWDYSIATVPHPSTARSSHEDGLDLSSTERKEQNSTSEGFIVRQEDDPCSDDEIAGRDHDLANVRDDAKTAAEIEEQTRRLRRRAADSFYVHLAQRLPKQVQLELHQNRFLVRDVVAAIRECFERAEGIQGVGDIGETSAPITGSRSSEVHAAAAKPPVFDLSAPSSDHETIVAGLVGINRRAVGKEDIEDDDHFRRRGSLSPPWNWERVPRNAPVAGQARVNDAVPWRTDEEVTEMIKMEGAEADDLAGLLVKDMLSHPGSENHQWEGCKGLADLAARDSDGLSAVRRQGGIQAVLAALSACPKDADVQRWGCQALVPLFGDTVVATPFRQAGVAAVIRVLAMLQDVETALKSMGAAVAPGAIRHVGVGGGKGKQTTAVRERWARAMKKVEIGRVKEQRRASLEKKDAVVKALEKQEAELAKKIVERRKSLELELQREIDDHGAVELEGSALAETGTSDAPAKADAIEEISPPASTTTGGELTTKRDSVKEDHKSTGEGGEAGSSEDDDNLDDALAVEQRRLEELDRLEHEAEMARLKKTQEANKPDPWAMTDADKAVYDKAFVKQDKDKDGFISMQEATPMFDKARASEQARRQIWDLCDPNRRGKLSKHGWRVAFHLARSMKSRKLELPETLPQCLYPTGYAPAVLPLAEAKSTSDDNCARTMKTNGGVRGEEGSGGQAPTAGVGAVTKRKNKVVAGTKGQKNGGCGSLKTKRKEKAEGKARGGRDNREKSSTKRKGSSTATVLAPGGAPAEKKNTTKGTGAEERKETKVSSEAGDVYRMTDAENARYAKTFDKLTKGKAGARIGGSEAARTLAKSGLSKADLSHLWKLADIDRDGQLCRHEFVVAMHLAARAVGKKGRLPLPDALPPCLAAPDTIAEAADSIVAAVAVVGIVDDSRSVVSSLGYPEGLSDAGMVPSGHGVEGGEEAEEIGTRTCGKGMVQTNNLHGRQAKSQELKSSSKEGMRKRGENEAGGQQGTLGAENKRRDGSEYRMSGQDVARYSKAFDKLVDGKDTNLGGKEAAAVLAKSGMGRNELGLLWALSDTDRDGALSRLEFSIAMHLASCSVKKGLPLPSVLPESLAALLPRGGDAEKGSAGKSRGGGATGTARAGRRQGQKELPVDCARAGHGVKGSAEGDRVGEVAPKIRAEAAERGPVEVAADEEGGHKGGKRSREDANTGTGVAISKGSNGKVKGRRRSGKTGGAAVAEVENFRPSKTRGIGRLSPKSSAAPPQKTPSCVFASSQATEEGGERSKVPKKVARGERSEIAVITTIGSTAKQKKSASKNVISEEAARKPLTPTDSSEGHKELRNAAAERGEGKGRNLADCEVAKGVKQGNEFAENGELAVALEEDGRGAATAGGENASATQSQLARLDRTCGEDGDVAGAGEGGKGKKTTAQNKPSLSREETDQLYAMTTSERAGYDVVFMQVDADNSGTIDGREAAKLLGKSGLTRKQLSVVWELADTNDRGELDHHQWAVAMHLSRCVAHKHLPLPEALPKSLGGLGLVKGDGDGSSGEPDAEGQKQQPKGSKARREAEQARDLESQKLAGRAIRMREQTDAFRLGKVTAAAFYITLAGAFGAKRHVMIPKVARSLPLDKARALIAAAGLGDKVLEDIEAAEARLARLRRRRVDEVNLHVKSTTSGATVRDVQLLACRLANPTTSVAVDMASAGAVNAVALILRMFEAPDLGLMLEALQLAILLSCACAAARAADDSASETSSLASSSQGGFGTGTNKHDTAEQPSPLLPLLRPLYAPSFCRKVAEIANKFPHSKKAQHLCCLLVGKLGSLNEAAAAAAARRCFADFCDPCVAAVASSLDEAADSDGSSTQAGGGGGRHGPFLPNGTSLPGQGVREVACQTLAVLAREPGLRRRLVARSAPKAVVTALEAAPRNYDVQLSCLETVAMLAESNRGMWDDDGGGGAVDAGRLAVKSVQTFVRDAQIHRAASSAILALLSGGGSGNAAAAARGVVAAGGATALCRVLATSPNAGEVQLPAVLAINALLERCDSSSGSSADRAQVLAIEPGEKPLSVAMGAGEPLEHEFISAGACELLCKSAKTFPRDREIRVGCVKAMGALCRGTGATARLIAGGGCEQLMKTVDAYPDVEARRAGLALLVGIAEYGDATSTSSEDERESTNDDDKPITAAGAGRVSERLGFVGGVAFAAAWLRETTAPAWAWRGTC